MKRTTSIARAIGYPPTLDVAYGAGSVWLASYDAGLVVRVDARSRNVVSTIRVGNHPSGVAVGAGRVWVTVS